MFWVSGFGFRVSGSRLRVSGFGYRVSGFGFRVSGFGFRIWSAGPGDARPDSGKAGSRLETNITNSMAEATHFGAERRVREDWKVDVRLPGKGNSNSHGARPVHQTIAVMKWIRTSRFSIKNSLSSGCACSAVPTRGGPGLKLHYLRIKNTNLKHHSFQIKTTRLKHHSLRIKTANSMTEATHFGAERRVQEVPFPEPRAHSVKQLTLSAG